MKHESTGLLVAPGEEKELQAAVERVIADRDLAMRLSQGARRFLDERLSWERLVDETEAALRDTLEADDRL